MIASDVAEVIHHVLMSELRQASDAGEVVMIVRIRARLEAMLAGRPDQWAPPGETAVVS